MLLDFAAAARDSHPQRQHTAHSLHLPPRLFLHRSILGRSRNIIVNCPLLGQTCTVGRVVLGVAGIAAREQACSPDYPSRSSCPEFRSQRFHMYHIAGCCRVKLVATTVRQALASTFYASFVSFVATFSYVVSLKHREQCMFQ